MVVVAPTEKDAPREAFCSFPPHYDPPHYQSIDETGLVSEAHPSAGHADRFEAVRAVAEAADALAVAALRVVAAPAAGVALAARAANGTPVAFVAVEPARHVAQQLDALGIVAALAVRAAPVDAAAGSAEFVRSAAVAVECAAQSEAVVLAPCLAEPSADSQQVDARFVGDLSVAQPDEAGSLACCPDFRCALAGSSWQRCVKVQRCCR